LSLYIETGDKRFLFDTGATGAFADNAFKMGVDLSKVDALILSHGHYDHGGGIETFLQRNSTAPVYLSSHAFGEHYNASGKYIGLPQQLLDCPRLIPVADHLTLAPGIALECCLDRKSPYPQDHQGLQILKNGCLCPEEFHHELYLVVEEGQRICFSGCAHRGVENIACWLAPQVLIGGFHFKHLQPGDHRLDLAAQRLLAVDCEYYTCHCTGQTQYDYLKQQMGRRVHYLSTGDILEV
jgi:7,8-dihydropterin-6-yl-methyl-4-(beta-D-ribofuranosyl)aminobenzene 5'-phosphate synthase